MLPRVKGKVTKIGSSLHVVIPKKVCDMINLKPGDLVIKTWDYVNGRLLIYFVDKQLKDFIAKVNELPTDDDFKRGTKEWRDKQ